ncbi:glycoside hydrolase family 31 protein [Anaeromicropila herbilytica]|uniref:Alpha-glucosidase n=1 Tax=Anaeromicropila herbilytica TaxID=2785025 RepID=A0A7R7IG78_9FIRM|nr:glycoside hydrolase family 31 protein [Anaeromicropila herbilytica]BCN32798.1 alpha-glucosidase [Anaeromicropila herbilytica]
MFGRLKSYEKKEQVIYLHFEEMTTRIEVLTDSIINVFAGLDSEEHHSTSIEGDKKVPTVYQVEMDSACVTITTSKLIVKVYDEYKVDFYDAKGKSLCKDYRKSRLQATKQSKEAKELALMEGHQISNSEEAENKIIVIKEMEEDEAFYGLGDKTGFLNKRGYEYEMWNTDDPSAHNESYKSLYKSIPFFITLKKNHVFGIFFDNHYKSYFDMGKESDDYYFFAADKGNLDYYFIYGEDMKEIIYHYTYLTGRTPLPQLWTLGYQQSRWSYENEDSVRDIARHFRELDIPCDAIHLDIDYMQDFKVFTWNGKDFPNYIQLIHDLEEEGFKIVTIIDPGVKKEDEYFVYEEGKQNGYFATDTNGDIYVNQVWPGDSVFPNFTEEKVREWWADKQKIMLESGVKGIWNDMNEPASFKGEIPKDVVFSMDGRTTNHEEVHNVYGHFMSKATFDGLKKHDKKRPFVITRACFAGTQKYSTVWTGDNQSLWPHLQMAIPQLINLGMSGIAFAGTDIGGFGHEATKELLSRWIQVGCFSPLCRNHSASGSRYQEPWMFDKKTLDINRKYIKLRYQLIPYLYDLFYESEKTGLPIMRPLILHYQSDEKVKETNDEFLVGENVLVAPVVEQGKRFRAVYLPEGKWVDYWTREVHQGKRIIIKEAPLDICPIYVKSGSIIPNYPDIKYIGEKEIEYLILDLYDGVGSYTHYQDNGEDYAYQKGEYNQYQIELTKEHEVKIRLIYGGYDKKYKGFILRYHGREEKVMLKGDELIIDLK